MNYELVKELKDAGFPYQWDNLSRKKVVNGPEYPADVSQALPVPTLSELIEACGEDLNYCDITKSRGWWRIMSPRGYGFTRKTPEEVIALFWIVTKKLNS